MELIQDDERLRQERKRAKKNRDKYVGVSSEESGHKKYSKNSLFVTKTTVYRFRGGIYVFVARGSAFDKFSKHFS